MFKTVLPAIDTRKKAFYDILSEEDRKSYAALVIMRYMSSLSDQSPNQEYELLMVNDLVNIGFWELSKYPDLQHLLLCVTGLGSKQYHPWIAAKKRASRTPAIDELLRELHPDCNDTEIEILRMQYDARSIKQLGYDAGKSDAEVKELVDNAKNIGSK